MEPSAHSRFGMPSRGPHALGAQGSDVAGGDDAIPEGTGALPEGGWPAVALDEPGAASVAVGGVAGGAADMVTGGGAAGSGPAGVQAKGDMATARSAPRV